MKKIRNFYIKEKIIDDELHQFLLLFHFKIQDKNYFNTYNEFLYSNTKNKYSLFGFFDDSFKIVDNFVFLMEYPETSCYLYFQQNINPLQAVPNSNVGFLLKKSTCEATPGTIFSGLTKHDDFYSYLDGINDKENPNYWYYSLGQKSEWLNLDQIPAYALLTTPIIKEVNLFIEINSLSIIEKFQTFYSCKGKLSFHFFPYIITVMIFTLT